MRAAKTAHLEINKVKSFSMHASDELDPPLVAGLVLTALNALNLLFWAFGHHVSIFFYAAFLAATLGYATWYRRAKLLIVCGVLIVFILITINDPVTGWDARSIWFFHAKRIFFHQSLYATLDGYADWSHNDYPILVPAMAASIAATVGYWNEVLPRAAEVLALAPALFFGAHIFRSIGGFCIWVSLLIFVCWGEVLGGYMDSLVAVYFSLALLAMAEIYKHHSNRAQTGNGDSSWRWMAILAVSMLNLLLLKNEGLALSAVIFLCLTPLLYKDLRLLALSLLPFIVFAVVWKIPALQAGVSTDLLHQAGQLERAWLRLTSWRDVSLILSFFKDNSMGYGLLLAALALFALFRRRPCAYLLPPIAAILVYGLLLFSVYLSTYHELQWHLATSANRVLIAVNMATASLILYALGDTMNRSRRHPYWGEPSAL
jgi:hypothetical protein